MSLVNNQYYKTVSNMFGKEVPAQKDGKGNWFVEINGHRYQVDPNTVFSVYDQKAKISDDLEEQVTNHKRWEDHFNQLKEKGYALYQTGKEAFKKAYNSYLQILSNSGCNYADLDGKEKELAKEERYHMHSARSNQIKGCSNGDFFGRLAADEAKYANQYRLMQNLV